MPEIKDPAPKQLKEKKSPFILIGVVGVIAFAIVAVVNITNKKATPGVAPTDISEFRQAIASQHIEVQELREEFRKAKQQALESKTTKNLPKNIQASIKKNSSDLSKLANLQGSLSKINQQIDTLNKNQAQIIKRLNAIENPVAKKLENITPAPVIATNSLVKGLTNKQVENLKANVAEQIETLTKQLKSHKTDTTGAIAAIKKQQQTMKTKAESIEGRTQAVLKQLESNQKRKTLIPADFVEALAIIQIIRDRMARGKAYDDVLPFLSSNLKLPTQKVKDSLKELGSMRKNTTRSKLTLEIEAIYREISGEQKRDAEERAAFDFGRIETDRCKNVAKYMYTTTVSGNLEAALKKIDNNRECRTTRISEWERDAAVFVKAERALAKIEDSLVIEISKLKDVS